jgi:hypothetical protein
MEIFEIGIFEMEMMDVIWIWAGKVAQFGLVRNHDGVRALLN